MFSISSKKQLVVVSAVLTPVVRARHETSIDVWYDMTNGAKAQRFFKTCLSGTLVRSDVSVEGFL